MQDFSYLNLVYSRSIICAFPFRFVVGNWSSCSVTCGIGYKSREVRCQVYNAVSQNIKQLPDQECFGKIITAISLFFIIYLGVSCLSSSLPPSHQTKHPNSMPMFIHRVHLYINPSKYVVRS